MRSANSVCRRTILAMAAGVCCALAAPSFGQVTVSGSTGANGTYTSLTNAAGAFLAINGAGSQAGNSIVITITADVITEAGTNGLNNGGWTSLTISPSGVRTISGSVAAPLINLNGASNVTVDGLNDGTNSLTISNTSTSSTSGTSTIRFINGASNNMVTRCAIRGSATVVTGTAGGNILFSTTTGTGNNTNTIQDNDIGPAGANLPIKCISAVGTNTSATTQNTGNIINNNRIFDFFGSGGNSVIGIDIRGGNSNWTISNNRIYQTATRTFTSTALRYAGITVISGSTAAPAQFHTISGNIIGFGAANGTGTTTIAGSSNEFRAIDVQQVSSTTATNIQNNTISGINQTSSRASTTTSSSAFIAVAMGTTDGLINATGNTIGSLDGSSTIVINESSTTASTAPVIGFYNFSFFATNVSNNNIGSITIQGTGTTVGFRGILVNTTSGLAATINNNTIGASGGAITDTQVGAYAMYGIQSALPNLTATGNTVRNMSGSSNAASTIVSSGLLASGSTGANTISQNTIHSLSNASGAAANSIYGMSLSLPTATNLIERNFIHSFSLTSTVTGTQIWGISCGATGTATYQNNMIRLGVDAAGNSTTLPTSMIGIRDASGSTNQYYFNTVYLGGTGVLATPTAANSFCFFSDVVTVTRAHQNNIFWNARSNAVGGGVAHLATREGGTAANPAGLTSNYNILYFSGTDGATGVFNGAVVPNLPAWRTATGQDNNSQAADPQLINPTGSASTVDLHIHATNPTPIESAGIVIPAVTNDFDGQTRASLTPTDIGADAGNFTPNGGACCLSGGGCTFVADATACTNAGGSNFQNGVSCASSTCAPVNDSCASATALGLSASYSAGTTSNATNDGSSTCDASGRDVWYTVTLTAASVLSVDTCTSSIDTVATLYSGTCGSLTEVACNDDCGGSPCGGTDSCLTSGCLSAGTYRLRISDKSIGSGGAFNVRATAVACNDVCGINMASATIPGSGGSVSGNLSLANFEGNADSSCMSGTNPGQKRDVFYYFTPSSSCPWKFSTCGTTPDVDTIISIHTACPTAGSNNQFLTDCVDQGCTSGNLSEATYSNLVAGTPYIVRVALFGSSSTPGPFTLNVTPSAPANDTCSGAATITVTSGTGNAAGDNSCATDDGLVPSCGATSKDLWWTFTTGAAQAGNWRINTCGSLIDTVLTVYSGACGSPVELAGGCNDDAGTGTCSGMPQSEVLVALAASTTYKVRVASKGASGGGAITLNLQAEIPPANDDCTAATTVSISGNCLTGSASGSNQFAAAALDGAQPAMCVAASKDVFFTVTIPATPAGTNNWIFDTCTGTTQDTVLQVLSACGGADLGCNDDTAGCGGGTQSKVTVSLLAGAIVKVRVASKGVAATGGAFTLTVTLSSPANDLCSSAQPVSEGSWAWYNHCATTDGIGWTASTAQPAGCDATDTATNANSDVWFIYTATCTAATTVDTCGAGSLGDTVLVVYPVGVCPPPNASKIACDDDFDTPDTCTTGGTLRSVLHFAATKGTQYLIRVGSFSGTTQGSGTLNISQPADATPPTITLCAGDQNGNADANCQGTVPDFTTGVTATDNCLGTLTVQQSPTAGTLVGLGDNPITITVKDAANNTSAPCTAHFFVNDVTAPNISQCASNQVGSADANCQAAVPDFTTGVTATDNCTASGSLVITQTPTAGTLVGLGATVVTIHVKDAANNESTCQAMFTVSDTTPPSIADCPGDIGPVPTDAGQPTAVVTWTAPTASDNCKLVSFTSTHNSGDAFPVGVTSVTYTATDGAGLMSTCVFSVTVVDNESPEIHDCPKTITVDADAGQCSKTVSWTPPTATDNQPGVSIIQSEGLAPGSSFPVGTTHIKYTATDVSSNTAVCEFDVVVVDNQDPEISGCPDNISLGTEAPDCSAVATWTAPTASDNCAIQSFVSTHNSGDTFPLGMTVVTYTATDVHGRTATCNFTVTVSDDDAPTISICASNQSGSADANCQAAVPDFTGGVTASDNCTASGSLVITQSPTAGTLVGLGATSVTITVKDAANNAATCNASFTVNDTTPPSIVGCPSNITSNTNAANCSAVVSWTAPTATDNCSASISQTQGPPPGSTFTNGSTTTIEYTASDGANSAICSFTVTVTATPDLNNDSVVTAAGDLGPFIQVLLGLDTTPLHVYRSDTNCDGVVNGGDIPGMVDALIP